ncbi:MULTISPECIES: sterol desaturase family protein [unclassified Vibrio]|uniref:sterol desaturase family protein n=1 Tax=unclassified Vibrio TaxID=2614977 RepID=UPI0010A64917|nr:MULTISPECIES: sterol desaturase family protein [unclassified Vibrio]WGY46990.1 sterol desaturase family protein [Vibrio sp. ABG19]
MLQHTDMIRLLIFILVLLACALWESNQPRKTLSCSKWLRWLNNLGLVGLNSLILALVMPVATLSAAMWSEHTRFGVLHWFDVPAYLVVPVAIIALDVIIYTQHVLFHRIPWLWRMHRMHHADQDIDVTTGARFHPLEIIVSMWVKVGAITLLGAPALAVVIFEVLLNASAMFNHSNARLPLSVDRWLRNVIVTPDMHRVHHSVIEREMHSNFGFFLSVWDRVFGTYIAQPQQGHEQMKIGLKQFQRAREQWLDKMLTQPFRDR